MPPRGERDAGCRRSPWLRSHPNKLNQKKKSKKYSSPRYGKCEIIRPDAVATPWPRSPRASARGERRGGLSQPRSAVPPSPDTARGKRRKMPSQPMAAVPSKQNLLNGKNIWDALGTSEGVLIMETLMVLPRRPLEASRRREESAWSPLAPSLDFFVVRKQLGC